ncbi:MAG: hypothetical protein HY805_00380 [Nitrospirae bacterium]|nr:hypothetical protein [Nitrospirota bacterium]
MEEQKRIELDLSTASEDVISVLLDDTDEEEVFKAIYDANPGRVEILRILYDHPHTPDSVRDSVAKVLQLPVKVSREVEEIKKKEMEKPKEVRAKTLSHKVDKLGVMDRVKLAMRGGREIRGILLKDTNKEVVLSVLSNPRITDAEVEMAARSKSVPEEVLRIISKSKDWMKNYSILQGLVNNSKTPAGISMAFVTSLKLKDLQLLERNKNVAEAVRSAAKRVLSVKRK